MITGAKKISFLFLTGISKWILEELALEQYDIFSTKINSPDFNRFFKSVQYNGVEYNLKEEIKTIKKNRLEDKCVLLYSNNPNKLFLKFYDFLKIITPSNINIFFSVDAILDEETNKYYFLDFHSADSADHRFLKENPFDKDAPLIIVAIKRALPVFFKVEEDSYLYKIIDLYMEAELVKKNYVRLLLYISILEMLIDNDGRDITYKTSRLPAVLLGYDIDTSRIIYNNIKEIYSIRSKMVHKAKFDKVTSEIVEYLSYLISDLFFTLLNLKKEEKELFNITTELGFGQRSSLLSSNILEIKRNKLKLKKDLFPKEKPVPSKKGAL